MLFAVSIIRGVLVLERSTHHVLLLHVKWHIRRSHSSVKPVGGQNQACCFCSKEIATCGNKPRKQTIYSGTYSWVLSAQGHLFPPPRIWSQAVSYMTPLREHLSHPTASIPVVRCHHRAPGKHTTDATQHHWQPWPGL